jgi:hypothetical protein
MGMCSDRLLAMTEGDHETERLLRKEHDEHLSVVTQEDAVAKARSEKTRGDDMDSPVAHHQSGEVSSLASDVPKGGRQPIRRKLRPA